MSKEIGSFNRWVRLFSQRGATYKSLVIFGAIAAGWLLLSALPLAVSAWSELAARTPLGIGRLTPIEVTMSHLTKAERAKIIQDPTKVNAHLIRPNLKLVGVGRAIVRPQGEPPRLELGLFTSEAEALLKKDLSVSLETQAPSLELLLQDMMSSERGEALKSLAQTAQQRMARSWTEVLPLVKDTLSAHLTPEEWSAMLKDELLMSHIKRAFMVEVSQKLDLQQLGEELAESEALAELGGVAMRHVNVWGVIRESLGGTMKGIKGAGQNTADQLSTLWSKDVLTFDATLCFLQAASLITPRSVSGVLGLVFGGNSSALCGEVKRGAQGVATATLKAGAKDLTAQVINSLNRERDATLTHSQALIEQLNQASQAPLLLKGFWGAISLDHELKEHIKKTYGEGALARLTGGLRALAGHQEINKRLTLLKTEVKSLASEGFKTLILDRSGKGPNPLLLAVIQERLSGQTRPIIHLIAGNGASVKPGYVFQAKPLMGSER